MNSYITVWPDWEAEFFDSVLGLAVEQTWYDQERGSMQTPFVNMIESGILDSNMFSVLLPNDERDGDLMFGGYNDSFIPGDLVKHPLYPSNTTKWQIEAQQVSMHAKDTSGRRRTLVIESLAEHIAKVINSSAVLAFPTRIANILYSHLNWTRNSCSDMQVISCEEVSSLPTVTLMFGGHDYELNEEDYVARLLPPECADLGIQCIPMIERIPDGVVPEGIPRDFIIIGSSLLKEVLQRL